MKCTYLVVNVKLVLEHTEPLLVDCFRRRTLVLCPGVHRTPLAVPHAQTTLVHPLTLLLVAPPQAMTLGLAADVLLWRRGEAEDGVVVDRVCRVLPPLVCVAEM